MVRVYIMILIICAIFLFSNAIYIRFTAYKKKNKLAISIIQLCVMGAFTCLAYTAAISHHDVYASEWAYTAYFILIDWTLVTMLFFSRQYTGIWLEKSAIPLIYSMFGFLDNASILMNFRFHHAFNAKWTQVTENSGCYIWEGKEYYLVHLVYCYILVAVIVAIFLIKTIKTSGYQRTKYLSILLVFLGIIIGNAVFMAMRFSLDISVSGYAIATMLICYFTVQRSPRALTEFMLGAIAERIECALIAFDENDICIYYNQLTTRMFGQNNTAKILEEWFRNWKNGQAPNFIQNCNWNDIYEVNGEECRFDIHFTKIYDKRGRYSGCYFSFYDVTSDYVAYEEEKYRSSHDPLTGALNRESFYVEVRSILDSYPTTDFVMVCSDVKGFKLINDMFGIDVADKILIKIADVIRGSIRAGSTFARLEADRFAVFMPKERFSEEMFRAGAQEIEYTINNSQYRMNILIGVYDVYDRNATVVSMCDRAFLAIDSIHDNYSSSIAYYGEMLRNEYMNEQKILAEFEEALSSGQFAMFLQPIVKADGQCNFAEALVRWVHPTKGIIPPGGFVPILENTGYIYKLDLFVWEQACKRLAYWNATGLEDVNISVNISVKDFYYVDIYETLTGLVEKYHINPANLRLEITESVFMTEKERQLEIINMLIDYGFMVEIDDFGSGYSSLNMLKEMPASVLKIDMNFLSKTSNEEKARKIIDTIIILAKALEMEIIVEGVETQQQYDYLKSVGADLFQGYLFDRPIPVRNFEEKYLK